MLSKPLLALYVTIVVACASSRVHALEAIRLSAPITLDGKLDEADWQRAPSSEQFIENMPNDKTPARERTQVRVLYDDKALYVGVRAYDSDPARIVMPWVRRDKVFGTSDNFNVWIDPTGAKKFAQFFRVNPRGVLADGSWSEDQTDESFAPDYDYEAVPALLADGWSAEFRIPWSTLRMPTPAPAQLHIIVFRNQMRETRIRTSNVPLGRDPVCFLCVAEPLTGITNVPSSSGLELFPYVAASLAREAGVRTHEWNAGLDVKWRPNASWVLDGTLRPNFSQLELDTPQLRGNTRFALFFPEKRPFFLEGSDLYGSPFGLVYTRAITDPRWGARATHRSEGVDATVLTVADKGGGATLLPHAFYTDARAQIASQATLARVRAPWTIGTASGGVAAMFAHRNYEDGSHNTVASTDGLWKLSNNARLRGQVALSDTQENGQSDRGHVVYVDGVFNDGVTNLAGKAMQVSSKFRADLSSIFQNGFQEASVEGSRCWRREGYFYELCPGLSGVLRRTTEGELMFAQISPNLFANGNKNSNFNIAPRIVRVERTREGGPLHRTPSFNMNYNIDPNEVITHAGLGFDIGLNTDAVSDTAERALSGGFAVSVRPHPRVEVDINSDFNMLRTRDGNQLKLREGYVQVVTIGHISARDNVRLISQFSQATRNLAVYPNASDLSAGYRANVHSLTYTHRWGLGKELNVGVSVNAVREFARELTRTTEAFVKVGWSFAR